MFERGHGNSSKPAYKGFPWTPAATMQKPALIALPLRRQYDPESQGRDLEISRTRPNWRPMKPPVLRVGSLMCIIKFRVPRVSSGLPVQPPSVQPPEARWSTIYCMRNARVEVRPEFRICSPIGALTWAWGACCVRPPRSPPTAPVPHQA